MVVSALAGLLPACGGHSSYRPIHLVRQFDVEHRTARTYATENGMPLLLDAYLPVATKSHRPQKRTAAVLMVHGGGWSSGSRSIWSGAADVAAGEGIAAFTIDYALATPQRKGFPNQLQDVLKAVRFIRQRAAGFRIDSRRIALVGGSAGATLVVDAARRAAALTDDWHIQAVAAWSGVYDFLEPLILATPATATYLGCPGGTDPACTHRAQLASAVNGPFNGMPPTLLATSDEYTPGCEIVDPQQARAMHDALAAAKVRTRLDVLHLCAHAEGYTTTELQPTLDFLGGVLHAGP